MNSFLRKFNVTRRDRIKNNKIRNSLDIESQKQILLKGSNLMVRSSNKTTPSQHATNCIDIQIQLKQQEAGPEINVLVE